MSSEIGYAPRFENDPIRFVREDDHVVDPERVLTALDDPDCRALLEATREEALTAQELAAECAVPRSTTYRKVELLTDAGLLEERVRIRPDGKHASEYTCTFEDLTISLSDADGIEVGISQPAPATAD